jgi:hypothetical protein
MNFPTQKGILPHFMGGLGNQLWVVSAAYVASKTHDCPLYIPKNAVSNNRHNHLQNNYSESLFKYFGTHLSITNEEANSIAHKAEYRFNTPSGFQPWDIQTHGPGTVMYSYYQFYPCLQPFETDLRSLILQGLDSYIIRCKSSYDCSNAAFLHIRRGDYVGLSNIHFNQPIEYYICAVNKLLKQATPPSVMYVLSDDYKWISEHPYFQSNPIFKPLDIQDELESLALMSLCTAGAICANSTFSWWGAFLGAYKDRAPVYIPEKWISNPPIVCMFPSEWQIIKESELFPIIDDPDTVFVTLSDQSYYPKAKRTIEELRSRGRWGGSVVLITVDFTANDADYLQKHAVTLYSVNHICTDKVTAAIKTHPLRDPGDNRHFGKLYQWDKLYSFSTFFSKWKRVVFLDAGLRVLDTVQPLLDLPWQGKLLASDDQGPYDNGNRFECQLGLYANPAVNELLFSEYSRDILDKVYFLNCMFVYDTSLLQKVCMEEMIEAMNKYTICHSNEMGIMNLFFTFKLKVWEPFPHKVGSKYLFAWSELNYKEKPSWNQFHFIKYSCTI